MKINIIYRACEGEGVNIGTPQVFIRTQGCSLHCKNCDTLKSWSFNAGTEMSIDEILEQVKSYGLKNVSITGGNPLEAEGMLELVTKLHEQDYWINIEVTGQDMDENVFDTIDFISCDIKTPSTGVQANLDNIKLIVKWYYEKLQLKAVCADEQDLDFIIQCYRELEPYLVQISPPVECPMVITPCYTERDTSHDFEMIDKISNRIMDEHLPIRPILQQHKIVYGSKREDV